jgi:hypothetical protein
MGSKQPEECHPPRTRERDLASNQPTGDGARKGAIKKPTQLKTTIEGEEHWTKRSKNTGQFIDVKKDEEKFKGVRKE